MADIRCKRFHNGRCQVAPCHLQGQCQIFGHPDGETHETHGTAYATIEVARRPDMVGRQLRETQRQIPRDKYLDFGLATVLPRFESQRVNRRLPSVSHPYAIVVPNHFDLGIECQLHSCQFQIILIDDDVSARDSTTLHRLADSMASILPNAEYRKSPD